MGLNPAIYTKTSERVIEESLRLAHSVVSCSLALIAHSLDFWHHANFASVRMLCSEFEIFMATKREQKQTPIYWTKSFVVNWIPCAVKTSGDVSPSIILSFKQLIVSSTATTGVRSISLRSLSYEQDSGGNVVTNILAFVIQLCSRRDCCYNRKKSYNAAAYFVQLRVLLPL